MSGFDDLFWLVEVVDAGTFSGAAAKHGISSAAISKRVRLMEQRLNVTLLMRTTRHLRMTEVGNMYYQRGKQLLQEFEHLEQSVTSINELLSGQIRINAPMSYGEADLMTPINEFMQLYPEVKVVLHLDDHAIDIFNSDYDVVIRVGSLEDSSLVAQRLADFQMFCCASPKYLQDHGEPQTPSELKQHNCLVYQQNKTFSNWLFTKDGEDLSVEVKGSLVSNNGSVLRQAGLESQGIILLPEFIVREQIAAGKLMPILTSYDKRELPVYAIYPTRHYLPLKVKRLIEFLKERL